MRKKWLALALSLTMVAGCLTGCGGSDSTTSNTNSGSSSNDSAKVETLADGGGKVLNIYVWNDEFSSRFEKYYPDYDKSTKSIGDVKVNFIQNANEGNNYQDKLDAALKAQDSASADDKVDMFLCEMDYVNKYTNTDKALDVKALGLTDEDMSQMYDYTKQAATGVDGVLRGVSWQGCPGGFVYRRSYAKQIFGTDDPAKIQEQLSDWDKFDAAAATVKEKSKGKITMLSGFDDALRVFSNNVSQKFVRLFSWIPASKTGLTRQKSTQITDTTRKHPCGQKTGPQEWVKMVTYLVTSCQLGALTSPWQKVPELRKTTMEHLKQAEAMATGQYVQDHSPSTGAVPSSVVLQAQTTQHL